MASDLKVLPLLVGLGVRHFSVGPAMIPTLKAHLSRLDATKCKQLAQQAIALRAENEVEELLKHSLA